MASKLFQATLVLTLAITASLAEPECNFKLSENVQGNIIRVQVGSLMAAVKTTSAVNNHFKAFAVNGNNVTVSDQTGSSRTLKLADLPHSERELLQELNSWPLKAIEVFNDGDSIEVNPFGGVLKVKLGKEGSLGFLYYGLVYSNNPRFGYKHVFYKTNSAVVLVDNNCEGMEVMPLGSLLPEMQEYLKKAYQNVE